MFPWLIHRLPPILVPLPFIPHGHIVCTPFWNKFDLSYFVLPIMNFAIKHISQLQLLILGSCGQNVTRWQTSVMFNSLLAYDTL